MNTIVPVQILKESPAVLSLGNLCGEIGYSCEWHPGQPSCVTKNGRHIECKTDSHIPMDVPSVQAAITRPELLVTGSRHKLWATTSYKWRQSYQNGFNPSRKDRQVERQVRQTSLQLTWKYHRQHCVLPRILQQNRLETERGESTIYLLIFRKTRIAKYADARKSRERQASDRADRTKIAERFRDLKTTDHTVHIEEQESRMQHKYLVVVQYLVFTDHSHSTMSHMPDVPPVLSQTSFLLSLLVTCGDPPDCCS